MKSPRRDTAGPPPDSPAIDRRRYRRIRGFLIRLFVHVLWHDVLFAQAGLTFLRSDPVPRWVTWAKRYRVLAVEMGGVLIKLGQYLSARVDLLPLAVISELAGLQDEVPAADFSLVEAQIADDFERSVDEIFQTIDSRPLGAASLAQVHQAVLRDGQSVVVKVLRPGIDALVETDLKAIALVIRWLKGWRFVRQRVDLEWLIEEFTTTTRRELDLEAEGRHAERFAENFAADDGVYIPRIFWQASARRTLTQENVAYLKIADLAALDEAGIDRCALANKLYLIYMEQIFHHEFVHADPHPGNLFVRPLSGPDDPADWSVLPGEAVPPGRQRPFQILFVDFGMVAEIPPRLREALRRYVIAVASRDATGVVQALMQAGSLLPGADATQIEEAVEEIFDRFWGLDIAQANRLVRNEAAELWRQFGQVLLDTPIQVQVDLMFTLRAIELLTGLASQLDETFNPWQETVPFAEGLAKEAVELGWEDALRKLFVEARRYLTLPADLSRVVAQAGRGRLVVRSALAREDRRRLDRLHAAVEHLGHTLFLAAALVAGAVLHSSSPKLGAALMLLAVGGYAVAKVRRLLP